MWMTELPPFVPFYIGALLAAVTRGRARSILLMTIPLLGGLHLLAMESGFMLHFSFLEYSLTPYRTDRLSLLFGYLFHIAAFISVVFALHVRDTTQHVSGQLYIGSALGAVFAGDLLTLFVFWELLALSSVFLVWARRSRRSFHAGLRYLVIQVLSGVLLLSGTLIHLYQTGSLAFDYIGLEGLASWLIFIAFGIKCAFPLLHNWLTDAYPEATPTGTVFLSAFTTKVAVYALARAFPGTELLIYIGAVMTSYPIFYAIIQNDLRRILAYSMMNQLGFMVVGIGIGTSLALNGAVAHAFNDVIFKGLLFMSMGAVLHMTGRITGSDLGGLYKSMPITTTLCIVGALSISAFPLFSGFVSKAMIMSAALDQGHAWIWLVLVFASAGVLLHAGIEIPFFAFFAHDSGIRTREPPLNMLAAMTMAAVLCILIGSRPQLLYQLLPFTVDYNPFDSGHVLTQLQLLFFSALAFTWLKLSGRFPPKLHAINLDAEWAYRRLLPATIHKLLAAARPLYTALHNHARKYCINCMDGLIRHHGPQGILARTWPTGSTVLWVAILLGAYLILYYI